MTVGRPAAFLLLAVALVVAFGHACVLPVHVHAAGHDSHDHPTGPADGADASRHHHAPDTGPVHVASCDAVGTPVALAPAMPSVWAAAWADVPTVRERPGAVVAAEVRPAGTSPPLFLLYAALLI